MRAKSLRSIGMLLMAAAIAVAGLASTSGLPAGAQTQPRVYLQPVAQRVDYDDGEFSVIVRLDNLNRRGTIGYDTDQDGAFDHVEYSTGLGAFEADLTFDPAVVRVASVEVSDFLGQTGRTAQCFQRSRAAGHQAVACVSTGSGDGPQGSATLARFTFRPIANGTSYLVHHATMSGPLGDSFPIGVDGGIVEVINGPDRPPDGNGGNGNNGNGSNGDGTGGRGNSGSPRALEPGGVRADAEPPSGPLNPGGNPNGNDPDGSAAPDPDVPVAGTGYRPPGPASLTLAGLLAAAGAALVLRAFALRREGPAFEQAAPAATPARRRGTTLRRGK